MNFSQTLHLLKEGIPCKRKNHMFFWALIDNQIKRFTLIGGKEAVSNLDSADILADDWESFREIDFKTIVQEGIKSFPKDWREGQKVFNYIDMNFGSIAREVQTSRCDCFYDDKQIEDFIHASYMLLTWNTRYHRSI